MPRILRLWRGGSTAAGVLATFVLVWGLTAAPRVDAQLLGGAVIIRDVRVMTSRGWVDGVDVIIKKGEITQIGRDLSAPMFSKEIDGKGKSLTPGLIDVGGGLASTATGSVARGDARAGDAFNRYATEEIREALSQGVTAIYLAAGRGQGVHGVGSVIRLVPEADGAFGEVVEDEAALCVDFGSFNPTVTRARLASNIVQQFEAALDYRGRREDYAEALETYEKELVEYAKKLGVEPGGDSKGEKKKGADAKKQSPKQKDGAKKQPPEKKSGEKKDGGKKRRRAAELADDVDADAPTVAEGELAPQDPRRRRGGRRGRPAGGPPSGGAPAKGAEKGDKDKKPDAPKKPGAVRIDPAKELLLSAIDRELPVRIEAHRSSDILNAIELAERFRFDWILEGGTEAHLVADQLAEADVPVILSAFDDDGVRSSRDLRSSAENGKRLRAAGVDVFVGTGGARNATRFALLTAQLAASAGAIDDPLATLTGRAAKLLGLEETVGSLRKGRAADVVLWSGDPHDPASRVEAVYVGGKLAYEAPKEETR